MTATAALLKALKLLEPWRDDLRVVGPAAPEQIQASEEALGVVFPPSYRRFLADVGAGSILGREIYGVVRDPLASGPPNVVWMNLDRRTAQLPKHLILVADLDDSSAFALDLAHQDNDRECQVVRIWPGEPPKTLVDSEIASSFGSFFLQFSLDRLRVWAK
jgi:hypothetical protein